MDQERKKIIINEIMNWKAAHLLPEHYCNFLLSLYTQGEDSEEEKVKKVNKKSSSGQLKLLFLLLLVLTLFGLTFLVIYFTDFSTIMQTAIAIIFSSIVFALSFYVKKIDKRFTHLFIFFGALLLFLITIHVVTHLFPNEPYAVIGAVSLTCAGWITVGKIFKIKYLFFSGIIGLFVVLYFLLF